MSESMTKLCPGMYILPKTGDMRVPGLLIATGEQITHESLEKPLQQVRNVASLPGIVGYSIAMPDIHWGYGFPIGGIAAMDIEDGVISPGGVGYDINCGVRLALVPLRFRDLSEKQKQELLAEIYHQIPSGTGQGHKNRIALMDADYAELLKLGAEWSIRKGFGLPEDLEHIESRGKLEGADIKGISTNAKLRGQHQLATIGSGNHFIEIGEIETAFDPAISKQWKVEQGQTYILIHTGSRGFGHQICQDFLDEFLAKGFAKNLPDRQLVAAPIQSDEGKRYWSAMASAANFAFNNRQQILHFVRVAFEKICRIPKERIPLLYDVCHNIAKLETHQIDGKERKLCVHRKGATRAYGPNSPELSPLFQSTGQPVLIPGDMGRASYLLAGLGNPLTWCSCCHGAGRAKSRVQSMASWGNKDPIAEMKSKGVHVIAHSIRTIAEEMPDAYKDVDQVIAAVEEASLAKKIAKLRPFLVLKG